MKRTQWSKGFVSAFVIVATTAAPVNATWVKEYDSQEDENTTSGTHDGLLPWGEANGFGISSWYLIAAAPDAKIERLSLYVHNVAGMPNAYDWGYRIKIGPTSDTAITDDPDSQVSAYTTVRDVWDPADTFLGPGWHDVDLTTPYITSSASNYILKFEYLGDSNPLPNQDNYWYSRGDRLDHDCYAQVWADGQTHRIDYLPRLRMYANRADLEPVILRVSPDVLWSNRLVHLTLDFRNASDADVTENYDVVLQYLQEGYSEWNDLGGPREVAGHPARQWKTLSWVWLPDGAAFYFFRVKVDINDEVFETDEDNNELPRFGGYGSYQVKDPPSPPIRTLILADSSMMVYRGYSQGDVDTLMTKLDYLAQNDPRGRGVVLNIGDFSTDSELLHTRDQQWDANMGNRDNTKSGTNAYVEALDWLIETKHHCYYPDLRQVIIVGSHEIIPMHVRTDEVGEPAGALREIDWSPNYDADTDMRLLYEVPAPGNYLTDAKYADLGYADDAVESHLTRELVVARLVETPAQICAVIDNYFAVSGTNPMDETACIGSFDFKDGAYKAGKDLEDYGYSPDKTLIADSVDSTLVAPKMEAYDDLIYIGGHSTYNNAATAGYYDENDNKVITDRFWAGDHASEGDTEQLDSLPTAAVIAAGCHGGALLPNKTYHEPDAGGTQYHDFPEEFASKGAIAYLGATAYTWITTPDGGSEDITTNNSEQLCSETVRKFAAGWTIGQAYRRAANDYYLEKKDKVMMNLYRKVLGVHQLYGIPGYKKETGVQPPPGGFHFEENSREQYGDRIVVRTTLCIDSWIPAPDGTVLIPGTNYTGGPQTPVLPVIRYEEPDAVPPGTRLNKVYLYESLSQAYEFANVVPTQALAQSDSFVPAEPFAYPDYYPTVAYSGFVILNEGAEDASVGMVLRPVQFNPMTGMTRVWEQMVLEFEYDMTQVAFADSFAGGDLAKWTVAEQGAASVELDHADAASMPYCVRIIGASAQGDRVKLESCPIDVDFTKPYRIECLFRYSSFHWDRFLIFGHVRLVLDQASLPLLYDPVGDNSFVGNSIGPAFSSYAPSGTWMPVEVYVDPATREYTVRINDTLVGTVTYQDTVEPSQTIWFEDNGSSGNYLNAWYDDFLVGGSSPPPQVERVWSMADHGVAGALGLEVNLEASTLPDDSAVVTTESRQEGVTKLVIDCDGDARLPDPPEDLVASIIGVNNGDVTGNVLTVTAVGDVVTINLTPLPDQDTYTVTLASSVIAGDNDFMIRALQGEVNNAGGGAGGSQVVNALDLSAVRLNFTADVTVGDNAKYDMVSDGAINALDLSYCRIQFTHTAP